MSARIPLVVLGAGWVVREGYLPHLLDGPFQVASIYDPDREKAAALVERFLHAQVASSLEQALLGPPRAVLIASPSPSHPELASRALRAGSHVLCEKPTAIHPAEADELAAAERAGGRLVGAAVCRYRADVRQWMEWTASIGPLRELELIWVRHAGVPAPGSWQTRESGGYTGVFADLGYHLLDLAVAAAGGDDVPMRCLTARAVSTGNGGGAAWYRAQAEPARYAVADQLDAALELGSIRVSLKVRWVDREPGDITSIRAIGARGAVELEGLFGYSDQRRVPHQRSVLRQAGSPPRTAEFTPGPDLHRDAFRSVLQEFAAVCGGGRPAVGLREIRTMTRIIEAISRRAEAA